MKRKAIYFLISLLMLGCKSYLYNVALESMGIYDDTINLSSMRTDKNDIVFFPMRHIGTEPYYADVQSKVDSLNKKGYYFYFELIEGDINDDTLLRKFKKINGLAYNQNGYTDNIDSLFKNKFKAKKTILSQPSYKDLGVDSISSKRVDVNHEDIISYYEEKYNTIVLEPCDFETSLYEETTCNDEKLSKEVRQDIIVNFRNQVVINEIISSSKPKIAVIYGENHIRGIKEGLLKEGYIEN